MKLEIYNYTINKDIAHQCYLTYAPGIYDNSEEAGWTVFYRHGKQHGITGIKQHTLTLKIWFAWKNRQYGQEVIKKEPLILNS